MLKQQDMTETARVVFNELSVTEPATVGEIAQNTYLSRERLLNRWGRVKKPQLHAKIEQLEQRGQMVLPGFDKALTHSGRHLAAFFIRRKATNGGG